MIVKGPTGACSILFERKHVYGGYSAQPSSLASLEMMKWQTGPKAENLRHQFCLQQRPGLSKSMSGCPAKKRTTMPNALGSDARRIQPPFFDTWESCPPLLEMKAGVHSDIHPTLWLERELSKHAVRECSQGNPSQWQAQKPSRQ